MGQCVSKRCSSSSSPSPSSEGTLDEAPLPKPILQVQFIDSRKGPGVSSSTKTFLFVRKRLTFKESGAKKSLEGRGCQNTSPCTIKTVTYSSTVSPHGGRVRPTQPDHPTKVTRRGVLLDEVADPNQFLNLSQQRRSTSEPADERVRTQSADNSLPSGFSPPPVQSQSSPLRRLNDLKLEQKMLRDRFFSADKAQPAAELPVKKNGYSSPSPVKIIPETLSTPKKGPEGSSYSHSPVNKNLQLDPAQRQHGSPPQQSFIPRPSGPVSSTSSTNINIANNGLPVVSTKLPSGIPRFNSPTGSSQRIPKGQRGQLPMPIASSKSSHQKETEEVNRFRVDSSYVVNKSASGGGFTGMSRLKQERMIGMPNSPVSAFTNQAKGQKVIPTRSLYSPYNNNGNRLTGLNGNLVKRPEATKPFYTMVYNSRAPVDKKGTPSTASPKVGRKAVGVTKILDNPAKDDKKGQNLILRSVTWTKEDEETECTSTSTALPNELASVDSASATGFDSNSTSHNPKIQSQNSVIPVSMSTGSTSPKVTASVSYTKYSVPTSNDKLKKPLVEVSTTDASSKCHSSLSYTVCKNPVHQETTSSSSTVSHDSLSSVEQVSSKISKISSKVNAESPKLDPSSIKAHQLSYTNVSAIVPNAVPPPNEHQHRLSTDKLFHSSTTSSVLSSNDNNEMSSDSDYLIDDEIEDQPDLITTTTTLKTDNNSSLLHLASNIGSSLESLQIESDYSDDDLHHKENRLDLSGLSSNEGGQLEGHEGIANTTVESCEEEGLDKIEVISLHSDETASNTSEKVDDVKSEVCLVAKNAIPLNAGSKSDTKVKKRLSASLRGARGTPTSKMVLDRTTMNYDLRSSHRTVAPTKKAIELPPSKPTPRYQGVKNGALKQDDAVRRSTEDLLFELHDMKQTLFQLKTVLEEQNRREKEKDEIINKLLQQNDQLKKSQVEFEAKGTPMPHHHRLTDADDPTLLKTASHKELHQSHHSIAKSVIKKS